MSKDQKGMTELAGVDVSQMRCPECKSTNVDCQSDRDAHVHLCLDCGYETRAKAVRR